MKELPVGVIKTVFRIFVGEDEMKAKVAKKYAEKRLKDLKPYLEENSVEIESAIEDCIEIIQELTDSLMCYENQETIDVFQSFICHGISVALIKSKNKGENNI